MPLCDEDHASLLAMQLANLLTVRILSTSLPARAGRRRRNVLALGVHRLRPRLLPIAHTAAAAVLAWYVALLLAARPAPGVRLDRGGDLRRRDLRPARRPRGRADRRRRRRPVGRATSSSARSASARCRWASWSCSRCRPPSSSAAARCSSPRRRSPRCSCSRRWTRRPSTVGPGLSPIRFAEALIGGGVALGVTSLFFPPDPALIVGRAVQAVFAELGRSLERIAARARATATPTPRSGRCRARATSSTPSPPSTTRSPPGARPRASRRRAARARGQIDRYGRTLAQVDFAVRNTRVLARDVAALHARRTAGAARARRGRAGPRRRRVGARRRVRRPARAPARSPASRGRPRRARRPRSPSARPGRRSSRSPARSARPRSTSCARPSSWRTPRRRPRTCRPRSCCSRPSAG